ncbi:MAG: transglycosylase family protein [Chloroflexota bacterium]|nr:transglycosylase family protein [Chloroflexota bacterium]
MPEAVGRLRAVLVALFVAAIIVSVIPAAAISANEHAGINRFLRALGEVESRGNYEARNSKSGAYGKYQIMPANWPGWAKKYLGSATAPQTPKNQERVARAKVKDLHTWLGNWPNVAHWWLTGSGERNRALWSASSTAYVEKVMAIYHGKIAPKPPVAAPPPAPIVTKPKVHKIEESNGDIAYAGRWKTADHGSYAGGRVLYSERNGATATFTFDARSVTWIGPVGSTRGKARVSVDGVDLGVVNMRRSKFKPRAVLFSRSWADVGRHVVQIQVIGSGRPVAIDQFVITR